MVYKFFDKKSSGSGIKNEIKENKQMTKELYKPIIIKFEKRRVYSSFKNNTWDANLADMQLINKFDKGIMFLLCFYYFYYVGLFGTLNVLANMHGFFL